MNSGMKCEILRCKNNIVHRVTITKGDDYAIRFSESQEADSVCGLLQAQKDGNVLKSKIVETVTY